MSKFGFASIAVIAIALIVSCEREIGSDKSAMEMEGVQRQFIGYFCDNTKTVLDDSGTLVWQTGDKVRFYTDGSSDAEVCEIAESGSSARFNVIANRYLIALYGAVASMWSDNGVVAGNVVKAVQDGSFGGAHVSMARTTDFDSEELLFYNVTSILKFRIQRQDVDYVLLESRSNAQLFGETEVLFNVYGIPVGSFTGSEDCSAVKVKVNGNTGTFYIALLPGTYKDGFTLSCFDVKGKIVGTVVIDRDIKLSRNKILNLGVIDEHLTVEPQTVLESIIPVSQIEGSETPVFNYHYIAGYYCAPSGSKTGIDYEGQIKYNVQRLNAPGPTRIKYCIGSMDTAEYHIRPAEYLFETEVSQWSFCCYDRNSDNSVSGATQWSADFSDIYRVDKDLARVEYVINNADKLKESSICLSAIDKSNNYSTITSDYAYLKPSLDEFEHFEFIGDYSGIDCASTPSLPGKRMLYESAGDAAENPASIEVMYNGNPLCIDFLGIHMKGNDNPVSIQQLQSLYPDLVLKLQLVPYTIGLNTIPESAYGIIESQLDNVYFYPSYPDLTNKNNEIIKVGSNESAGKAAIGHRPIVVATLINQTNNRIILTGYFKISIVSPPLPYVTDDFVVLDYNTILYTCGVQEIPCSWTDVEYQVVAQSLGITFNEFQKQYTWETGATYEKTSAGVFSIAKTGSMDTYGTVSYEKADEVNDNKALFKLTLNKTQVDAVGISNSKTLYARFTSDGGEVYLGLTFKIGSTPKLNWYQKNPVYWYDDVAAGNSSDNDRATTLRCGVHVPMKWMKGGSDNSVSVRYFVNNLNDYWIDNKVQVRSDYGIINNNNKAIIKYRFSNDNNNIKVNNKPWLKIDDNTLYWCGEPALTLGEDGILTFKYNSITKNLLNWAANPHEKEDKENMLYCNIDIVCYLEDSLGIECEFQFYQIHVRFLRPITMYVDSKNYSLTDGRPMGSSIPIHEFFSVRDWNNFTVFTFDSNTQSLEKGYYPEGGGEANAKIDWYDYYGIKRMNFYLDSVETDVWEPGTGHFTSLEKAIPSAAIGLVDPQDPTNPRVFSTSSIDLTNLNTLNGWSIWFANNAVYGSNYNIKIKVGLEYEWGEYFTDLVVPVNAPY